MGLCKRTQQVKKMPHTDKRSQGSVHTSRPFFLMARTECKKKEPNRQLKQQQRQRQRQQANARVEEPTKSRGTERATGNIGTNFGELQVQTVNGKRT